jgi:hypothetical protein
MRSQRAVHGLLHEGGAACGYLEDTTRAKRLWASDGRELVGSHLTAFAFDSPRAGGALLAAAAARCAASGVPSLFVALAAEDAEPVLAASGIADAVVAPATVFAAGLEQDHAWNVNSAEV